MTTKDILNKYVSSKITYTFGEDKEILDGSTINKWLTVDENSEVTFNEKEVEIIWTYLLVNIIQLLRREILLHHQERKLNIGGGGYGWSINKVKEIKDLISIIIEGKTIAKEPAYYQTALSHGKDDIGNTYVEIDLSGQHLWFYKNGSLITQGDVVTGNDGSDKTRTPGGIYKIKYKEKNATLKGEDYASPVNIGCLLMEE